MKNKTTSTIKIVLSGIMIVFVVVGLFWISEISILKQENDLLKTILYTNSQVSEVSTISQKGDDYYSEASFFYENGDYNNVESSCRLARGYYSDSNQNYREISSELKRSGIEDPLINIYLESLEILAEIELNIFEACEHLESASRYYDKYYNTDVSYDDSSYEMGTSEIDSMNEKIRLHDQNVRDYNDLLSDFKIELEKKIN
ncbi:hypothetical protein LCGC14_0462110 [marine sediment metagenome]|uniref:Uncharacterized protein n=1 Tax=marine sediment metagenome TaxID=412755 RepID=A0A0F9SXL7_9ZZZZ